MIGPTPDACTASHGQNGQVFDQDSQPTASRVVRGLGPTLCKLAANVV